MDYNLKIGTLGYNGRKDVDLSFQTPNIFSNNPALLVPKLICARPATTPFANKNRAIQDPMVHAPEVTWGEDALQGRSSNLASQTAYVLCAS